jgi:hypothetical protein
VKFQVSACALTTYGSVVAEKRVGSLSTDQDDMWARLDKKERRLAVPALVRLREVAIQPRDRCFVPLRLDVAVRVRRPANRGVSHLLLHPSEIGAV